MSNSMTISQIRLVGQLESFVIKDGYKLKYLRMKVAEREYWLKIPKPLRQQIDLETASGTWLEVLGTREPKEKMGFFQLKATHVKLLAHPDTPCAMVLPEQKSSSQGRILVCQKSNCWDRGGKMLCRQLEEKLCQGGLSDRVEIKLTGCLKQCKKGPNMVVLPDKASYSRVQPYQIEQLLEKHFSQ